MSTNKEPVSQQSNKKGILQKLSHIISSSLEGAFYRQVIFSLLYKVCKLIIIIRKWNSSCQNIGQLSANAYLVQVISSASVV